MSNVVEFLRKKTVDDLFETPSLKDAWPIWKPKICKLIAENIPANIMNLGDNLRSIMISTNPNVISKPSMSQNEMQSMKSGSGHLWESLVTWYCNLCLIGTRTVVVKKVSHVPKNFIKAIEIDYDGDKSTAEADLFAITFPDRAEFVKEIPESFKNETGKEEKIKKETKTISQSVKNYLEQTVARHFTEFELGIISCKLPWNDFAVIPEHWDLVYELSIEMPEALGIKKITIGMDSDHGLNELNKFFYAFVTMPSQKPDKFKSPKTLPIIRLKQLSGGNYWGLPTQVGVKSIKEIFATNFSSSIGDDHLAHIKKELLKLKTDYNYFGIDYHG